MRIRRAALGLVAMIVAMNPIVGASAAKASQLRVFTPPFSEDFAGGECIECQEAVSWSVDYAASKADGSVLASAAMSSDMLETPGNGLTRAVARVGQSLSQTKGVNSVSGTIEFDITSASVARSGAATGAEIFLDGWIWNSGCDCESYSWSRVIQTAEGSQTFSGQRSITVRLDAPSSTRRIKGTTLIRGTLRSETILGRVDILRATQERSATASANGTVRTITYQVFG